MMSLFSSFDLKLSSLQFLLLFFFIFSMFKFSNKFSFLNISQNVFLKTITTYLNSLKPKNYSYFSMLILTSLFMYLMLCNFVSILPFMFPFTSQISLVSFFSLSFWVGFTFFHLFNSMKSFFYHCIPEGSPIALSFILFLIEVISNLIRPITLTVRLSANILAGHLLMILLSKFALFNFLASFSFLILNLVEIFVALIQAYIFLTMVTLYYSDVN